MNNQGQITEEILLRGIDRITDLEAITQNAKGEIYLATSLYRRSHKPVKENRRLLVKVARKGKDFRLLATVDLRQLLLSAAAQKPKADWAQFLRRGAEEGSLNLEGLFHQDAALYLGFKGPLHQGRSVILRLGNIEQALQRGTLLAEEVTLWKTLSLRPPAAPAQHDISDLFLRGKDLLYVAATGEGDGSLWQLPLAGADAPPRLKAFYPKLPLEGVAATADAHRLLGTFDRGEAGPSYFTWIEE
jgi:hypothetical protein